MSWRKYTLTFRLLSPLHVGYRKVGNLMQTRGYVPGKNVWAALTARLTRTAGRGADGRAYVELGAAVQNHFRFTYLFPALATDGGYEPHYPWDKEFDYLFLDSYASSALNYERQSAADGLLHETEFIAPTTRRGQQVYLTGSLSVRTGLPDELLPWREALAQLQFGGERGYGWGRVQPLPLTEPVSVDGPVVTLEKGESVTAHTHAQSAPLVGPIEPLLGWERNNRQGGQNWRLTPQAQICYAPGSQASRSATFIIGPDGIWQAETHNE